QLTIRTELVEAGACGQRRKYYQKNSYQRLLHKRQRPKTLKTYHPTRTPPQINTSTARNTSSAPPRAPAATYRSPAPAATESAATRSPLSPAHRPKPYAAPTP